MALETTDAGFESEVLKSELPVLIDFWAEWCGPCKQLSPIIDELSNDLQGKVKVMKVNIDENTETPAKYNVRGIPTLILFKNGIPVSTKIGALPKSSILSWIEGALAEA